VSKETAKRVDRMTHKCDDSKGDVEKESADKIARKTVTKGLEISVPVIEVDDIRRLLCHLNTKYLVVVRNGGWGDPPCRERSDGAQTRRID
jgi:glutaredoxin